MKHTTVSEAGDFNQYVKWSLPNAKIGQYECCSKSNVTHFGISEIGNTVQPHRYGYASEGYKSVYKISCHFVEFCVAQVYLF